MCGTFFPKPSTSYMRTGFTTGERVIASSTGSGLGPPADFAPAKVRNLREYNALGDADQAMISSDWQRDQYPEFLVQCLRVLHSGVDTAFFTRASKRLCRRRS